MRNCLFYTLLFLALTVSLASCGRTPRGVIGKNKMADLIVDLELADAYIDSHIGEFADDSSKMALKQSIFKKHGITQQDYDSSLVWYAHNMEDYIRAYDQAIGKLKARTDKLEKDKKDGRLPTDMVTDKPIKDAHNHATMPMARGAKRPIGKLTSDSKSDSADLWQGPRDYMLTAGYRRGFITFDVVPDANKLPGDRYLLAYKLTRGGNEFKVSLNVDYTDGSTSQVTRGTNSDGWVTIDVQSDTARQVRRVYGYVSYDMKRGHTAHIDSLMLMRTRFDKSRYGFINAQRLLERGKK